MRYKCEGDKGCCKPCELEDFQEFAEPNEEGFCRYTGEKKHWCLVE